MGGFNHRFYSMILSYIYVLIYTSSVEKFLGLSPHLTQKFATPLTPSPSPAGEGNKKIIKSDSPSPCGRGGWGVRADFRST
jgi:hypothetical protein